MSERTDTPTPRPTPTSPPTHPATPNADSEAFDRTKRAVKMQARHEFDGWAHTYDQSIVQHLLFRPSYRLFMAELHRWRKDQPQPFDVLDIGSGTGTWLAWIAGSPLPSRRLVGLDYSSGMCSVANDKSQQIDGDPPRFVNGDSEHLPFADRSFDAITCSNSFHHYPHQAEAVREMRRVLRPGGRLMIIDGFRDNIIGWVVFDVFITRAESRPGAPVHHVSWSVMRRYFEDAGLGDIRQIKRNIWAPIFLTMGTAK